VRPTAIVTLDEQALERLEPPPGGERQERRRVGVGAERRGDPAGGADEVASYQLGHGAVLLEEEGSEKCTGDGREAAAGPCVRPSGPLRSWSA